VKEISIRIFGSFTFSNYLVLAPEFFPDLVLVYFSGNNNPGFCLHFPFGSNNKQLVSLFVQVPHIRFIHIHDVCCALFKFYKKEPSILERRYLSTEQNIEHKSILTEERFLEILSLCEPTNTEWLADPVSNFKNYVPLF